LEYLQPDNLPVRTAATWTLGYAHQLQGDRAAARQAYTEVISLGQTSGNIMLTIAAATGLGQIQEGENQLYLAAESYRRVLQLAGEPPLPAAAASYLGLARIFYQWNDLDAAQQHAQQGLQLARQMETVDTPAACEAFLARLKLVQGDVAGAAAILVRAEQFIHQRNFVHRMPEVAAAKVRTLLRQGPPLQEGNLAAAAALAEKYELPISQARVYLARRETGEAIALLEPFRQRAEAKGLADEWLKALVLQAVAHQAHGEEEQAVQLLGEALVLAEPGGFIRVFVDEGQPMARLLHEAATRGISPDYVRQLLAAFPSAESGETQASESELVEPLSEREIEVLQLIAEGLTNSEITSRLYLSLHTVKTHARNIYGKLGVRSRTQAVAKARALGVLPFS
jgi:LuxR family maltose regulon positive regulatory protein